jgi:hypothetical protein
MTDATFPTPDEVRLLAELHDDIIPCRKQALMTLALVRPDIAATLADEWTAGDQIAVLLIDRKMTWAEAAQESQKVLAQGRDKIIAANREWGAEMNAENEAELNRRKAAANALLQWSAQQQMINAATRPIVTNCSRFASSVNCTSY